MPDTVDLAEVGAGYTFYWCGKGKNEPREAGVGFPIRPALVSKLETLPTGISDRLMTVHPFCWQHPPDCHQCHAPTMMYADEEKEAFYQLLSNTLNAIPKMTSYSFWGTLLPALGATTLLGHQYWAPTVRERRPSTDSFC